MAQAKIMSKKRWEELPSQYCQKCGAELTATDHEANRCTQCQQPIRKERK